MPTSLPKADGGAVTLVHYAGPVDGLLPRTAGMAYEALSRHGRRPPCPDVPALTRAGGLHAEGPAPVPAGEPWAGPC
jgi:hypothetical protein